MEIQEEQFLELQRQAALGRLLAGVAHELSAPIGSILSNRDVGLRLFDRIEKAVADSAAERPENCWRPAASWRAWTSSPPSASAAWSGA